MNSKVWGHRGCRGSGYPPENSLAAFQSAFDAGVGGIELDVFLSDDGVPVVFHDLTLDRMTGVTGTITSSSLADLKKLPLLSAKGKPTKETIPTLAEVLDLVEKQKKHASLVVNIELKDPRSVPAVAGVISARLAHGWKAKNFLVSSFDLACLRRFQAVLPHIPRGVLFECGPGEVEGRIAETADLLPATVNIPLTSLTPAVVKAIAAAGAKPVVWSPQEINPRVLPPADREQLLKNLRELEFVMITDFPKELLQALKPNRAKATASGFLAACLVIGQQDMLFRPAESGLERFKSPADYPELSPFGFREANLTADDGVPVTIWERKGRRNQPHFVLFHGNRAHWGDTGVGGLDRDRKARLKFIQTLASAGVGVTAVTLRGFGNSSAVPSELGFVRDLRAVVDYLLNNGIDHRLLMVAGESLGTWSATQTAVLLTERCQPPALLSLQNPFTSMAEVGAHVVSHFPIVKSLQIPLSASSLDRYILKSHFYTALLLPKLTQSTVVHIATSGKDGLVHPSHSEKLTEIAQSANLRVVRDLFAQAYHHTIPPIEYGRRLLAVGGEAAAPASDGRYVLSRPTRPITNPKQFT